MSRFITQIGQSRAILGFIVLLGVILGYLDYYNSDPLIIPDESQAPKRDTIDAFSNFSLDFSVLDNEIYKSLEIFGENPVDPQITGERRNPFLPL